MSELKVNLNFFGDKHGKNGRDTHFSCITKFIQQESLRKQLISTEDIVNAINNGQLKSNENRKLKSKFLNLKRILNFIS